MRAGEAVAQPLAEGKLDEARRQLGWHLVSRDVSQLDESLIAAATIGSLAENCSDSVVAPLFRYGVGGLPRCGRLPLSQHGRCADRLSRSGKRVAGKGCGMRRRLGQPCPFAADSVANRRRGRACRGKQRRSMADLEPRRGPDRQPECRPTHERSRGGAWCSAGEGREVPAG